MSEDKMVKRKQETFAAVALEHYAALYSTSKQLTRNTCEAQDLVQETYLRAYRFFHRFEPGTHAKAWLFTILRNAHISTIRKTLRQPVRVDFEQVEPWYAATSPASSWMRSGPIEERLKNVIQDEVKQALDELPEKYRQVVLLADLEDFSYRDIATVVGCPAGTVMSRLFRGRKLLRRRLAVFAREAGYIKCLHNDQPKPRQHIRALPSFW